LATSPAPQQTEMSQLEDTPDSEDLATTSSDPILLRQGKRSMTMNTDVGGRRKVARTLTVISNFLGTAAQDAFDDSEFKRGRAVDFPEIPGEASRNRALSQIREQYNQPRDGDGNVTPGLQRQRSRNGSPTGSFVSGLGITEGDTTSPVRPPASPRPSRSSSASSPPRSPRRPLSNTFPVQRPSFELQTTQSAPGGPAGQAPRRYSRRDTLDLPAPVHRSGSRDELSPPVITPQTVQVTTNALSPPMIVVSPDPETASFDLPTQPSPPLAPQPSPPLAPQSSPLLAPVTSDLSSEPPGSSLLERQ
jgi:hypothetical protein